MKRTRGIFMKRTRGIFLLVLGMMLAQCVSASAATVENDFYEALTAGHGTITLENDITIDNVMEVAGTLTIDLNGYVLTIPKGIYVDSNAHLIIKDSNTTAKHKFTPNDDGLWVRDEENGTEEVTGGVITGGKAPLRTFYDGWMNREYYLGGAVCVVGGKLTMEGGNIVGCSAQNGGGGVELVKDAVFTMSGGSIAGCTAGIGGAISCYDFNNEIKMSGTALIRDCRATHGGGIWISGKLSMADSTAIRGCIAEGDGGGVYVNSSSSLSMSDEAVIEDCKVVSDNRETSGGGVYVSNAALLTMFGDTKVLHCSVESSDGSLAGYGGGVCSRIGDFRIEGNALIENCAAASGGGLHFTNPGSGTGEITANGGRICGDVVIGDKKDSPCTVTGSGETVFEGNVTLNPGSRIEEGTFTGTVTNNGTITGGTFTGTVISSEGGTIVEGVSISHLQFIVTFDNDGTKTTQIIDNGGKLTEPTAPTKEDYRFGGWNYIKDDGTEAKWNFDTNTVTHAMTLTANWEANTYNVTVENDGNGTASADPASAKMDEEVTLTAMPKSGYHFKEWEVISGNVKIEDNKFTMPAYNVTVKAIFERNASGGSSGGGGGTTYYTLTFETNGGDSIQAIRAARGKTLDLSAYTPMRDGYDFGGWYADKALTQKITEIKLSGSKTVYADWKKREPDEPDAVKNPFADVNAGDWFYRDVLFSYEKGLMSGMDAAAFAPYANTTRAQIAVIFYRMEGSPAVEGENSFADVVRGSGTAWFYDAVTWAQQNGIMGGYGNSSFAPNDPITREQLAAIFYRYAQYKGYDTTQGGMAIREFDDYESISDYAMGAMAWAVNTGLVKGDSNLLYPKGTATRAELAALLHRFVENGMK